MYYTTEVSPLWQFPIWEKQTPFDLDFNKQIEDEVYSIAKEMMSMTDPKDSLWDYDRPALTTLKQYILNYVNEVIPNSIQEVKDLNIKFKCDMAWVNVREPGLGIELHGHPDASFAATYYVRTAANCGNLVTYDQTGNPIQLVPAAGKIVILPAYMLHEIQDNMSNDLRISISTDITQVIDRTAQNALVLRSWCQDMLKVKEWNNSQN